MHRRSSRRVAPLRLLALALALSAGTPRPLAAQVSAAEYAGRRVALASWLPSDGVIVALGGDEPEEDYLSFWQRPDFLYLTGIREPSAAMLLVRQRGRTTTTLFVLQRDPAREVWTGARLGAAGAAALTGEKARTRDALEPTLDSLLSAGLPLFVAGPIRERPPTAAGARTTAEERLVARLRARHPAMQASSVAHAVRRLRGQKSAAELQLIRRAAAVTVDAQRAAIAAVRPGMNEYELQALVEYTFRRAGADRPSFATIIGSGPNSTTLHYNADDRVMRDGDMVVMDIGASWRGYAADVTRSVPVNGRFTPEQRAIYQLVRDAQTAAERQATVGSTKRELADSAAAVLARGLARLGLVESPDATYDCPSADDETRRCAQYRMYYMHGLGHGIGLEVHDPDQFDDDRIAQGSAFTIEPGIYVRANLLDVLPDTPRNRAMTARLRPAVARYANVGVRIEDDYVVAEQGVEWISRAPREIDELEVMLARPRVNGITSR